MSAEQAHSKARSRGASVSFAVSVRGSSGSTPVVYPTYTCVSALPPPSVPPSSSLPPPPLSSLPLSPPSSYIRASAGSLPPTKHRFTSISGPPVPPKPANYRPTMTVSIPSVSTPDLEKGQLDSPLTPPSSAGLELAEVTLPIPSGVARAYSIGKASSRMRTDTRSTAKTLDLSSIASTGFSDVSLASPITPIPVAGGGGAKAVPGVTTVSMAYSDQVPEHSAGRRAKRASKGNWASRKRIANQRFSDQNKILGLPRKIFYFGLGMMTLAVILGIIGVVISLEHERVYPNDYYKMPNAMTSAS